MNFIFLILFFFSHAEVTNPTPTTAGNEQQEMQDQISNLKSRIETLVAENLSCKQKSDCAILGIGYLSCGGVGGYIITSKKNLSHNGIVDLAENHRRLSRQYSERYPEDSLSVCGMAIVPNFDCQNHLCVEVF